jgi:hypothetical protein
VSGPMLKVIGSGFGRTGTLSTKLALEQLGFGPCDHMQEVLRSPRRIRLWHRRAVGEQVDWNEVFDGFRSTVDFPSSAVVGELIEAFPEALVLHTVRDADRWYDSTHETIYQARTMLPQWLRSAVPTLGMAVEMTDGLVWDGLFDGRFEDRDHAIDVYRAHTADVIATVPSERLLVFDVADGWAPLCAFLGVPIPDNPFPRVNDRKQMIRRFRAVRISTRLAPVVIAAVAALIAVAISRWGA